MKISSKTIEATGHGNFYDYKTFYEKVVGTLREKKYPYYVTFCPFHKDVKNPNLRVNIITGNYRCYACGARGGAFMFITHTDNTGALVINIPQPVYNDQELQKITAYDDARHERKETEELTLALEARRAEHTHDLLLRQPVALQNLINKRGLTMQSITHWKLGYFKGTYTIPVPDIYGNISSLKFHKKFQTEFAKNQLMPWSAVTSEQDAIILVEGEWDMMLLQQLGFNAVTQTNGANSWDVRFNQYFDKKQVLIAYDNDPAGRAGAILVGTHLQEVNADVRYLIWPSWMQPKEDHVDFFVKYKQSAEAYYQLIKQAVTINNFKQ